MRTSDSVRWIPGPASRIASRPIDWIAAGASNARCSVRLAETTTSSSADDAEVDAPPGATRLAGGAAPPAAAGSDAGCAGAGFAASRPAASSAAQHGTERGTGRIASIIGGRARPRTRDPAIHRPGVSFARTPARCDARGSTRGDAP